MKEFRDRIAVVTGAASGIGKAMAERFAAEGMKVVMADVEAPALEAAARELEDKGAAVTPYRADVSKAEDIEGMAKRVFDEFGRVDLLCNHAGVGGGTGLSWDCTLADWQWVMGVNLWGVIHGVKFFLPRMIEQGNDAHIVNTASLAGLISGPGLAIYSVTKHAVVSLSETLFHELRMAGSQVGVSVLCPGWVNTKIMDSARNRPETLLNKPEDEKHVPAAEQMEQFVRGLLAQAPPPSEIAEKVFEAVRDRRFYILPHPQYTQMIRNRMEDILEERDPTYTPLI
ncbi:MAG TPA: SDR family NAD(P)-dependent oxidoreductase [Dehalococcoidia bacterium]|nr:SDR family NAD(P)-dependent oxidoreductase [Dehalococcoidia bacterium]